MKKFFAMVVVCLSTLNIVAQESSNVFALTKQGVVVDYLISAKTGKKVKPVCYGRLTVTDVRGNEAQQTVLYNFEGLNLKKKPLGGKTNIPQKISIDNGIMTFESDPLMTAGAYKTSHDGFAFKIPATLHTGDKIESGTVVEKAKFPMAKEIENVVKYEDFYVRSEEDIETPSGVFHCFKIEGTLNGTFQKTPLVMTNYCLWFSPKIGIVKIETEYYGEVLLLDAIAGM
ncbi:MAG: hypothetical protein J6E43_00455 [Prevotella sp.]|nr:hypothetical protein [Prevotella sp.]